jgi:hypothetical protein
MSPPERPQAIRTEPITDATAWMAADLDEPEGILTVLTSEHLDEISTFVETHRRRPLSMGDDRAPWRDLTRTTMPTLSDAVHDVAHRTETDVGTAVVRGFPVESLSAGEIAALFRGLGAVMGSAVAQNGRGDFIADVRDYGRGGLDNNAVRGYQTSGALRFHSDDSDLALLLCVRPAEHGGASLVSSAMTIYNELLRREPELLGLYYNGFVYDYRGEEPPDEPPAYRNAVFGYYDGQLTCRYFLRDYVDSAWTKTHVPVSDLETYALDLFEYLAARPGAATEYHLRAGDLQLVNDNVVVHARRRFTDEGAGEGRLLLRQWVNLDGGREFPLTLCRHRFGMKRSADVRA